MMAGVSDSLVSRLEHGEIARLSVGAVRTIAARIGIRVDLMARWQGGDLDRLLSARHSALGEQVSRWITRQAGWKVAAEVSFSIYGERGVVDLLAWHESTASIVVIELKTAIVDIDEILGTLDRKRRLAARIAAERAWQARSVSVWLIVADSRTSRRRVGAHRGLLRSALPCDGRTLRALFRDPAGGALCGICFWPDSPGVGIGPRFSSPRRVSRPADDARASKPRS